MQCPRCDGTMEERDRGDITIDLCTSCRGVWLDRGELEKLIARAQAEVESEHAWEERPRHQSKPRKRRRDSRGDEYESGRYESGRYGRPADTERIPQSGRPPKRRKSSLMELFDIFD